MSLATGSLFVIKLSEYTQAQYGQLKKKLCSAAPEKRGQCQLERHNLKTHKKMVSLLDTETSNCLLSTLGLKQQYYL